MYDADPGTRTIETDSIERVISHDAILFARHDGVNARIDCWINHLHLIEEETLLVGLEGNLYCACSCDVDTKRFPGASRNRNGSLRQRAIVDRKSQGGGIISAVPPTCLE